jgi:CTD small phosphatase-like protein 2
LKDFLEKVRKDWELIVFTASAPEYANKIINAIDPEDELFSFRLYRENCYLTDKGIYIKDLRILERPMERCVLVDNAAYSYGF